MNNADLIVATLKAAGIDRGFGIPSGNVLPLMEAMRKGGVDFVLTAHEGSAGFAADVTGRIKTERETVEKFGGKVLYTEDITFSSSNLSNRVLQLYPEETAAYLKELRTRVTVDDLKKDIKDIRFGSAFIDRAEDPKLVVAVMIHNPVNGHFGSTVSGPVFRKVMMYALAQQKIPPSTTKRPKMKVDW